MKKFILIASVVAAVIAIWFYKQPLQNDLAGFAYGNGRIEASEVIIASKMAGRVSEVFVKEGDIVEKGALIALLDTKDLEAKLELLKAKVLQAEISVNSTNALLDQSSSELKLAESNFFRAKELFGSDAISPMAYEKEKTVYQTALATKKASKANLAQAKQMVKVAQAEVKTVEIAIEDGKLFAPVKGRVLYKTVQSGEVVGAGQSVAMLLDLLDTSMSIYLPTNEAGRVDFDSEARIVLDAFESVAIPAKVTFISPKAQFTPKQIETKAEREKLMFKVKVTVDEQLLDRYFSKIRVGLPGVAYIKIDSNASWPSRLDRTVNRE